MPSEEATAFYELFADKQILQSGSRLFDCGNTMSTVIGAAHAFGFSYSIATTGFARLEIVPLTDVHRLTLQYNWDDPSQPQLERMANA